jgi:hypothetical protein
VPSSEESVPFAAYFLVIVDQPYASLVSVKVDELVPSAFVSVTGVKLGIGR